MTPQPDSICGHENCGKPYSEHFVIKTDAICPAKDGYVDGRYPQYFTPKPSAPLEGKDPDQFMKFKSGPYFSIYETSAYEPIVCENIWSEVLTDEILKLLNSKTSVADLLRANEKLKRERDNRVRDSGEIISRLQEQVKKREGMIKELQSEVDRLKNANMELYNRLHR